MTSDKSPATKRPIIPLSQKNILLYMLIGVGVFLLIVVIFGPQIWTRYVFNRYKTPISELPGNGGELASHLLKKLHIDDAKVDETTTGNDHYDPVDKTVRLSPDIYTGKSLTAIVIAAHEVGHALQHHLNYPPLFLRWRISQYTAAAEKVASVLLVAFPFASLLTKLPVVGAMMLLAGITILLLPVVLHLITLPVEIDASFNRALPLLIDGKYIPESAIPIARKILTAAALTYLAASLASILNFYRWIAFLRR